jgi:hypothetical protein
VRPGPGRTCRSAAGRGSARRSLALRTAATVVAMAARDFDLRTDGPPRERVTFTVRPDRLTLTLTPRR